MATACECVPSSSLLCCAQAVSELLSQHVLQNYDKFVAGIDEVSRVEEDLIAAHKTAKVICTIKPALRTHSSSKAGLRGLANSLCEH